MVYVMFLNHIWKISDAEANERLWRLVPRVLRARRLGGRGARWDRRSEKEATSAMQEAGARSLVLRRMEPGCRPTHQAVTGQF